MGQYKKTLNVYGKRYWKNIHVLPKTTDPEPFASMDLRYEKSFGGAGYALNPLGQGLVKTDVGIADNVLPVPNIQDPNNLIASPFDKTTPAGFLPLHSNWQQRQAKLGTYDQRYMNSRWPWFPADFDWSHFNAAPHDQQVAGYLRGDEKLTFENLHRTFSTYETQLPGIRPRCFTRKQDPKTGKRYFDEVNLNLDTLWVDMEKEQLVLVWRGWTEVLSEDFDELKHVFLTHESMQNERASIETCYQRFKQAQVAEDSEFSEPEKAPEAFAKKPVSAAPKLASLSAAPALALVGKESFANQMNVMLAKFGIKLDDLPPEVQTEISAQQEKLSLKRSPKNAEQAIENEHAGARQQLKESMAKLDIDIDNLPELSPKAEQEKAKFFEEFGLSNKRSGGDEMWAVFAAALPKIGMSAENLSSLIEQSSPQLKAVKDQLKQNAKIEKSQVQTNASSETPGVDNATQKPPSAGESFAGQDLSRQDFSGMDLNACDFSHCILTEANFSQANLQKATFEGSNLAKTNFEQANLDGANFENADLKLALFNEANCNNTLISDANFEGIQGNDSTWLKTSGTDALFTRAKLGNAIFSEAKLMGADFEFAELVAADFSRAELENATFEGVDAKNSNYFNANITGLRASQNADFSSSNFSQSKGDSPNFMSANFQDSDLSFSDIPQANFNGARLQTANLSAANLKQARFIKANLANCKMIQANLMQATFERANLSQTDLRGSNCYEVEFLNAELNDTKTDQANLAATKLA